MLSPAEAATRERGLDLKRVMRAAAARADLYDDVAIAAAVGVSRNSVGNWWKGAVPEPETLRRFAIATGIPTGQLADFVYYGGPAPTIEWPTGTATPSQEPLSAREYDEAQRWQDQRSGRTGGSASRPPRSGHRRATEG